MNDGLGMQVQPGDMVIRRSRWSIEAGVIGVIIGGFTSMQLDEWLVMWSVADDRPDISWHLGDALWVVDATTLASVEARCHRAS